MYLSRIKLTDWKQYEDVDIEFHPSLTILTGANGAGKTSILNILNRHYGWSINNLSTPQRAKGGGLDWFSGLKKSWLNLTDLLKQQTDYDVGSILYSNGRIATLKVPIKGGAQYGVSIHDQQPVVGMHIPSHRPIYSYQPIGSIPTSLGDAGSFLNSYQNIVRDSYQNNGRANPARSLKESLISLAIFGYGNQAYEGNQDAVQTFEGFQKVLAHVLPKTMGFQKISIREAEVIFETLTGSFPLEAVSGGVTAIIDTAWQVFLATRQYPNEEFVITIDEPENHLHPKLQKTFLTSLVNAFPNSQFIVTTHSPFIVTCMRDSNVYVLDFNENNKVYSQKIELDNKAATANDVLRDVLGLDYTLPVWASDKLQDIYRRASEVSKDNIDSFLKTELEKEGLQEFYPEAILTWVKQQ